METEKTYNNYTLLSDKELHIYISDSLSFKEYKNIILTQLINVDGGPMHIVWNFLNLKSIPWHQLGSHCSFMRSIDPIIWSKIERMTLIVKNKKSKIPLCVNKMLSFYNKNIPTDIRYL